MFNPSEPYDQKYFLKFSFFSLCSYHSDGNEQVSKCLLEDLRIKFPEEDISLLQSIILVPILFLTL